MRFSWKWIGAVSALVLAIVASVAVAAPSGDNGNGGGDRRLGDVERAGPRQHLSDLAKELGVSVEKLREAFGQVRAERGEPRRPRFGERPRRADLERRCTQLTDALASELDKSGDEVRAAIKAVIKADIEEAVDDERLTRQQADRILERIDEAECLPPFGPVGHHGIGCAGRPARPGGGFEGRALPGREELPAPPPGAPALMFAPAA